MAGSEGFSEWLVGRRRLLAVAGGSAALAAVGLGRARVAAAEWRSDSRYHTSTGVRPMAADYDELRWRWRSIVVGENVDPDDPRLAAAIADVERRGEVYLGRIDRSPARRQVFEGQDFSSSAHLSNTYGWLLRIALAWATPGSRFENDPDVLADVLAGLRLTHEVIYNNGQEQFDNWFHWEIAAPRFMTDTLTLVYEHVDPADLGAWLGAIDHFKPDPYYRNNGDLSTGANRVDMCRAVAVRGVLGQSDERIGRARDGLSDIFAYTTSGDGFYRDGSFVQHNNVAYTGTYGAVLLDGMSKLFALLGGSPWAIDDPNREVLYRAIEITFAPVIYDNQMLDCVMGRAICRQGTGGHHWAHEAVEYIIDLADGIQAEDPARAAQWRAMCKGWLTRDTYDDVFEGASVPRATTYARVLDNPAIPATPEPNGFTLLANMDRAVHRRPGWAYAISMASQRIAYYEYGNGENEWGFHTGSGMTYLYTSSTDGGDGAGDGGDGGGGDNGQFADAFWPTVDYYKLPGTTVDTVPLPRGVGQPWGGTVPDTSWVGGVSLGEFGTVGMDLKGIESPLTGRKSWFCFDDFVVALGAGLTGGSGHPVHTVVENRNLHADGLDPLLIGGAAQPLEQGWQVEGDLRWAHLDGVAGYVFPAGGQVTARRHERTGSWRDIRVGAGSTTPITRRWLTMWFDHGVDPSDAAYAYVVLPRASAERTRQLAEGGELHLLQNNAAVQAVSVPRLGIWAINFWRAGRSGAVIAGAPCAVMVREQKAGLTVAISDPTHLARRIPVTLRLRGYQPSQVDDTITVRSTAAAITLTVDTRGAAGATHTAHFTPR